MFIIDYLHDLVFGEVDTIDTADTNKPIRYNVGIVGGDNCNKRKFISAFKDPKISETDEAENEVKETVGND